MLCFSACGFSSWTFHGGFLVVLFVCLSVCLFPRALIAAVGNQADWISWEQPLGNCWTLCACEVVSYVSMDFFLEMCCIVTKWVTLILFLRSTGLSRTLEVCCSLGTRFSMAGRCGGIGGSSSKYQGTREYIWINKAEIWICPFNPTWLVSLLADVCTAVI